MNINLFLSRIVVACTVFVSAGVLAQSGRVEVQWLGQSTFRITSPGGKVILTDPWLRPNPITPVQYKNLEALGKIDVLLLTHAHPDHVADAPEIARINKIPLYGPGDLNQTLTTLGVLPPQQLPRFAKGGRITPVPGINVTAVHADHSSIYVWRNPATGKDESHPGGEPVGYIIELENGFRIWHTGDTTIFTDMKWISEYYKPDLVLLPIGGYTAMDPKDAAYALRELIKPKYAIPMHYGANPLAYGTPQDFVEAMRGVATKVTVLKPGEKAEF